MRTFLWYASPLLALTLLNACTPQESTSAAAAAAPAAIAAQPMPPLEICRSCGTIRSITPVAVAGQSTGAGAVIGGIVGGVAGNQVGGGSGQQIATAAGVVGGAVLGNTIERNRNATTLTDVTVDMDTGGQQTIRIDYPVAFGVGADVNVNGTSITLR